jgi:hypothetical protein
MVEYSFKFLTFKRWWRYYHLLYMKLHNIPSTASCIQSWTPSCNITLRIVLSVSTAVWNTIMMCLTIYIHSCLILLEQLAGAIFPSIQKNCMNLMTTSTTVIFQHTNNQVSLCSLFLSSILRLSCRHSLLLLTIWRLTATLVVVPHR